MVDYSSTFEVPPMRRLDIRRLSQDFREILKVQGPYFPILGLLEIMNPLFNIDSTMLCGTDISVKICTHNMI